MTIDNCTVTGNAASGYGGGIASSGTLLIIDSVITNNSVTGTNYEYGGGGIASSGSLIISRSEISNNNAVNGGGIAISEGYLDIIDSEVSGNVASSGGGIFNNGGALSVYQTTISGNSYESAGGGIFNAGSSIIIDSSVINNEFIINEFSYSSGGGICNYGSLTVTENSVVSNNKAVNGGGIYSFDQSMLTVTRSVISENSAEMSGGGIYACGSLTIDDSSISNNTASNDGGGIYSSSGQMMGSSVLITNSTITENTAVFGSGGGIYGLSNLSIFNCTFSNNQAFTGGGIFASSVTITGSEIAFNTAEESGGGVNLSGFGGGSTLTSNAIFGNTASEGGGIYCVNGMGTITNNTIVGNAAVSSGGGIGISNGSIDLINNIVSLNSSDNVSGELSGNSRNNLFVDPFFVTSPEFDSDGKITNADAMDLHLQSNSAAVDQGDKTAVSGVLFDLDGSMRIFGDSVDIGAYEVQGALDDIPYSNVVTTLDDNFDIYDGKWSIREAIYYAPENETILFADNLAGTINLTAGPLVINKGIVIDGGGCITIDGAHNDRVFYVSAGTMEKPVVLNGLTIQNGSAEYGSGIYNEYSSSLYVINCIITENVVELDNSYYGGNIKVGGAGIYNDINAFLYIEDSEITGNRGEISNGAGIYNSGNLLIVSSDITGNTSSCGAIYSDENGALDISNSTISGNTADISGGGIYCVGNFTIANTLITSNSASAGGGICSVANPAFSFIKEITNSTIVDNEAYQGAGINYLGKLVVNNSIILDEIVKEYSYGGADEGVSGFNNISTYTEWMPDTNNIFYDFTEPLFVDAASGDYHLVDGSIAIDQGDNELYYDADGNVLDYDRDGSLRIVNDTVDIGAYEYQASVEPIQYSSVVTTLNDSFNPHDDEWSLREAIYYATEYVTITFDEDLFVEGPGTIFLTQGELVIDQAIVIDGDGLITIDANQQSRVIMVTTGTSERPVVLNGLTIQNGYLEEKDDGVENIGGAGVHNAGVLVISNCTIEGNKVSSEFGYGGGIYNDYDCTLTVENCIISENAATFCGGGISNEGFLTVTDCTIEGNLVDGYGAGIEHAAGTAVIMNSVIRGNTVSGNLESEWHPNGAGIYGGGVTLTNCLIVNNTVFGESGSGGGIYGNYANITNCTIAGNIASTGAGIYNLDEITVNNSIILDDVYNENIVETNYQIIGELSGSNNLSTFTDWASGSNNIVYDPSQPLFVDAANGDYHLVAGSQAIDMGDNELAVDEDGAPLTVDLDGEPRILSDAVDIGAYEYSAYKSIYNAIRSKYSVFDLPESEDDINIIVVDLTAGDDLGDLKAAIATAGETELPDLIVVYTSDDANTLTYESADDELIIDFDSSQKGSVTIVGWGDSNFTLDANQQSRVLRTNGSTTKVNLGRLTITGGNAQGSKISSTVGGGIYNYYGELKISNCSIVGNTAESGGGIYNYDLLTVVNTVIADNSAEKGGGIYNSWDFINVINCTIAGNSAISGGGIYDSWESLILSNSIVSLNYASGAGANLYPSNLDTSHNNLIGGYYGQFVNSPVFDIEGTLTNTDTMDLHLRSDSIAIDAGDNSAASGLTDTDDKDRIYGETIDIGAYEFQGDRVDEPIAYSSIVTTLDDSFDPNDGVWSLREAIYYAPKYETITFADDLNGTITLLQGPLIIDKALSINGDGRITIDADHNSRVISVEAGTSETPVVLNGLTIQNGITESDSDGGGIYNVGVLTVSNCTVSDNFASSNGGGIYNENILIIKNSYIMRNSGSLGGGLFNTGDSNSSSNAAMTILNCVISENTAVTNNYYTASGGGIYNAEGVLAITNSTIAGNSSDKSCGGLYNSGELTLTNSIISSNYDKNGHSDSPILDAETSHNNIIGYYGLFVNEPVFDSEGNLTNADTMDLHLRSDSRAIDAGDNSAVSSLTDSDGHDRIFNGTVDIGAYEYQYNRSDDPIPYSSVVTTLEDRFDPNDGVWSLREALYYAPEYVTITFDPSLEGAITLTQGQLTINKSLAIDGEGRIVIDANKKSRAILVDAGSYDYPVALIGLTIQNGLIEDYDDGAGILNSSGVLTVSNCSILNNSSFAGGGIYTDDGNLTISNSVIRGNSAQYGGGVIAINAVISITNSTIVENTAEISGGGIYSESSLTLTNCTIAHNFASNTKDGIINFDNITVNNTIITDYILNESYYNDGRSISGSNNLSTFTDWTSGDNNIEYDSFKPLFIDEEGGDYHLAAGSQAIDMGANALAVDANNNALIFDLDGAARIVNDIVDIGAYESNLDSSTLLTPTIADLTFDDTEVTVTWFDVPNASGYQFEYKSSTDSDWTVMNVSNPSASFESNYELGYKIRVKALGETDDKNSAYSSTITIDPDYSVNYSRIRAKYSDFDLPESEDDINIIVVDLTSGNNLNDLKTAISTAGQTTLPDLIVVCTSDEYNTLRYTTTKTNEMTINIDAEQFGAVTIVSWGTENFTLNANQKSRVMTVYGASTILNLGGMTITGGNSSNSASNSNYGGGILNMSSTLTISDCTITGNASTYGGGLFSYDSSTVKIIGSAFSGNSATTDGGGIYGGQNSNVTVTDCTVSGNSATYGAGIYNGSGITMTVNNCQILDNSASTSGGGLFNTENSTLIVTDSVISGNKGTTRGGGFTNYYGNATFTNSEFTNNTGNSGGGIYNGGNSNDSTLTIAGCVISGNTTSSNGGGIYNSSSSNLTVTNSEISGNTASNYGGGIINYGDSLVITNSTIAGNSSRYGGGIDNNNKPLTVTNSIISSNYSIDNLNIASPNYATNNHNLIGSYYGLFVKAPMFDSEGNLTNADTMDLHLRTYSAAIDAGDNDAASGLVTDIDGKPRIYGDIVDIGAYEYQGDRDDKPIIYSSVVNTLNDSFDPDDDEWSLREAICYATKYVTITFADNLNGTIELTQGQLTIDKPLAIDGDGRIVIDANQNSRVLAVNAGTSDNPVVLNGLTIQNGVITNSGGGILNSGTLIITNSAIAGNSANYGGGIYNDGDALTIINCTIAGNSAAYIGGGIYAEYETSLSITNSIVTSNYANYYGVNISANNLDETSHHNLINSYYGLFVNNPVFDSEGNLTNAAAMDLHLRSDSNAIDAGDNTVASGLIDVEGKARIFGGTVDIGAYEYQGDRNDDPIPYSSVVTTLDDSFDPNDNEWSLREAIYYAPEYVTITFADNLDGTILLEQDQLVVDKALAIDGDGRITIDADHINRVILVEAGTSEKPVVLNGLTIQNGVTVFGSDGGGISNNGALAISNCAIIGNSAGFLGGGICNTGFLSITNAVIEDNLSDYGGGIASFGTLTITNSDISYNTAFSSGGAIENGGVLSIVNSAITDNIVQYTNFGGGIANFESVSITNCTIAGNSNSDVSNGIYNSNTLTVNNSIIADGIISEESEGVTISGSNNLSTFTAWTSGSENQDYDPAQPLFVNASKSNYRLAKDSQAIDMGNNQWAYDSGLDESSTDLAHKPRFDGDSIDIGAYEFSSAYSIDIVGAVSKQVKGYDDTNEISDSTELLTDWDRFYLELWAADVSEFAPGDTYEVVVTYNSKYHQLDTDQTISTPDGVTAEITDQTIENDGTATVIITLTVSDSGYTAPGSNTYWGSVLFTPSTEEGSGIDDPFAEKSLGVSVDGHEMETALIAMPYDFDFNNVVDVTDFIKFATVYGYKPGSLDVDNPFYAQAYQADFDHNGVVNVEDFISFATNYGIKKGKNFNIILPQRVDAAPGAPAQTVENELVIEEQTAVQTLVAEPQSFAIVVAVPAVQESSLNYAALTQPAQAESSQTLRQAYSSALLDLYDNQNESESSVELSAPAIDKVLFDCDEFDFLFDDSDSDADDNSDSSVDLSIVLDELELELI